MKGSIDIDDIKNKVRSYTDTAKTFDGYRYGTYILGYIHSTTFLISHFI